MVLMASFTHTTNTNENHTVESNKIKAKNKKVIIIGDSVEIFIRIKLYNFVMSDLLQQKVL